jgi:hypothetical protein
MCGWVMSFVGFSVASIAQLVAQWGSQGHYFSLLCIFLCERITVGSHHSDLGVLRCLFQGGVFSFWFKISNQNVAHLFTPHFTKEA